MAIVGDFLVGKALELLCGSVEELIVNNQLFKSLPTEIKSTLDALRPMIQKMVQRKQQLDRPDDPVLRDLQVLMEEGAVVVRKCFCKIRIWNWKKKDKYTKELLKLKEALNKQLSLLSVRAAVVTDENNGMLHGIQEVVNLLHIENQNKSAPIEARCALPELPRPIVGLDIPLEELKTEFFKEEVSILVLTAPGGCGKTTLATKFCHDQLVKDKFKDNIFFVSFTRKPNMERIIKGLYEQKGYKKSTSQGEATPVKWLQRVQMEKGDDPILLILDDVWSGSESLLEKFEFKMSNYKILVTSRFKFPRFGPSYHLQPLDYETAMQLFQNTASLGAESSHIPEHLSKEIVKHCNGFPLTITVVGQSLSGQPEEIWRSRVDEWSEGSSVVDLETDVLLQLQSSLDVLDNAMPKVKKCFSDLSVFPEDVEIQVTALFYMWAELYDLKNETLCIAKLNELNNRGLAFLQKPEGDTRFEAAQVAVDYSTYVVRQRDKLIRKLAIYNFKWDPVEDRERLIIEISGNNFPKWWREQTHPHMNARIVSISTDGEFSAKFPNMELPEAEVLVLNFQSNKSYAVPEFVEKMDKLKVLLVFNYSGRYIEMDNLHLLGSLSNLKNLRLDGVHFSCISESRVQFRKLHKLYWRKAGRYDGEDPVKFSHVFPNLKEMVIESCEFLKFPVELCGLIHLAKLEIICCGSLSDLPEAIGDLINLEVLRLGELFEVADSIGNLKKLRFLFLNGCYWLPESIGNLVNLEELMVDEFSDYDDWIGNLKKLRILSINRCHALPESIVNLVSLEVLKLENCTNLSEVPDWIGNLKKLKFLQISNNKKFRRLPEDVCKLKCLRHLIITGCYSLCALPESIGKLVNLEVLSLRNCIRLSELPESIRNLHQLNFLDIHGCYKIKELPEQIGGLKKTEVAADNTQVMVQNIHSMLVKQHGYLENENLSAVPPELREEVFGLDDPLEELKVKLFKGKASILIVTAPAGCGKTTLATKICQDEEVRDEFQNNIFFVTFSKTPNLDLIMKGLYRQNGCTVPTFQHEVNPEKWLKKVELEKGDDPLLLVLDDVWSGSESLLQMFVSKMSNYKIIVTSRSEFPRLGPSFRLQLLNYENAMQLFHHTASLGDKSSHISEHLSKEIVKHCNGFPLTITVVGRSLCGQPEEMWQSRVDEWSEGPSILDLKTDVLLQLQSSLDILDNATPKVKNCFLDLGAFPEEAEIQVTALFYMWAELYHLKKETSCFAKLCELNNRGLALLQKPERDVRFKGIKAVEETIDYSTYVVRQHDLLRKLAIYNFKRDPVEDRERLIIEICGNNFPKWWREQKHPYMKARLVSISTDSELSVKFPDMELPEAEVLVLNFQSNTSYALPEFVERMDKLKVLLVINKSSTCEVLDNFQLLGSLSNLRSLRLDRIDFSCITKSPVQLKNLHKLYMRGSHYEGEDAGSYEDPLKFSHFPNLKEIVIESCEFQEFPAELCELVLLTKLEIICRRSSSVLPEAIGNLVNLEVLRLQEVSNVPDSIGNLQKLKIFTINRCDVLPESIGNVVSLEVLMLEDCTDLSKVPDSIGNLKKLRFLKMSNNNSLGKLPEHMGELECLSHLIIDRCKRLYALPESIGKLVNLEVLSLRYCYMLMELPESIRNLRRLNSLDIEACCKIEELPEHIGELKSLRKLQMFSCNALRKLPESISHLEQLEEVMCEDWHARELWTPLLPTLKNLSVKVWKANIHG